MAKKGPSTAFILVDQYDLSGYTYTMSEGFEQVVEQTNGLGTSWEEHTAVGIGRVTLQASGGLYEEGVDTVNEALAEMGDSLRLLAAGPDSVVGGYVTMVNGVYASTYERVTDRAALTKANATYTVSGDYMLGRVVHGLDTESSASGSNESLDFDYNGTQPAGTAGAVCDLHVPALTLGGYTSVTITVRDSTDGISWADLVSFTNVTATATTRYERKTVAGTINRYLAIEWTFNGAGSGQSIVPFVSVYVNP